MTAKKAFIGYLSHEIRNPLATTILGIDILLNSVRGVTSELPRAKKVDILEDVRSSCEVATTTLNEVLMFDKIKSNLFVLDLRLESALRFVMTAMKPFRLQVRLLAIRATS